MRKKSTFAICVIMTFVLAACGSAPEPDLSPNDIANTSVAEAWMMVTLTQAALPTPTATATPVPPTPTWTAQPTFTFVPTNSAPTPTLSAAQDPCNQPPPFEPRGTTVQVQFTNSSNGSVSLALGMTQANSLGECGTYNFSISRFDSPTVRVLAGCYWAYGWVSGDSTSTTKNISALCMENASQVWQIEIGAEVVEFK